MPTSQRPGAEAPEDLLAEEIESPAHTPRSDETSLTRRSRARQGVAARPTPVARPSASRPPKKARRTGTKPLRNLVVLTLVGGLIATVALPAMGATGQVDDAVTMQQVAADNAQSLVVASDASASELSRESYS